MQPQALIFNIAVVVGIVGIITYWVRRFATFLGYKAIQPDVLQIADILNTQPTREQNDVVVAGYYGGNPTIVRFSHRVDTPGLDIQMRVPATINLFLVPKTASIIGEGRVLMRTGSVALDRRFNARSDHPVEVKMLTTGNSVRASLEQLCCSTQTGLALKDRVIELSELTIPPFTANHVFDHLQSMQTLAQAIKDMPGTDLVKVEPLPPKVNSWPVRIALVGGLICLVALLFAQPYSHPAGAAALPTAFPTGMEPLDATHLQQLQGWHLAKAEDYSGIGLRFLQDHNLPAVGRIMGDFGGRGGPADSAYFLADSAGQKRVTMISKGVVAYDAIFAHVDALALVPRSSLTKIQWMSAAPQSSSDGDGLLIIQNANDPTASVVLLRHGTQTDSARPADFNKIDLSPQQ